MEVTFQLPTMTKIAILLVNHSIKYLQDLSHDLLTLLMHNLYSHLLTNDLLRRLRCRCRDMKSSWEEDITIKTKRKIEQKTDFFLTVLAGEDWSPI